MPFLTNEIALPVRNRWNPPDSSWRNYFQLEFLGCNCFQNAQTNNAKTRARPFTRFSETIVDKELDAVNWTLICECLRIFPVPPRVSVSLIDHNYCKCTSLFKRVCQPHYVSGMAMFGNVFFCRHNCLVEKRKHHITAYCIIVSHVPVNKVLFIIQENKQWNTYRNISCVFFSVRVYAGINL